MKCIFPFGSWLESLIDVITFGWGKNLAGWIAKKLGYQSCGCTERKDYLNKLFNCEYHEQIKL
jgi:hypothetical protein